MSIVARKQCGVIRQVLTELGQNTSILETELADDSLDSLYQAAIAEFQEAIWNQPEIYDRLSLFQDLHREYQANFTTKQKKFIIVIPVADRPQHLESCLNSLLQLCKIYSYGGFKNNRYTHVSVIIADDSKQIINISENQSISERYRKCGLDIEYFGQKQQIETLLKISEKYRHELKNIIDKCDFKNFSHKGASVMRNIVYIKLQCLGLSEDYLIYFIDSDQEFNVCVPDSDEKLYCVNYFYELNRLFNTHDIQILTGKVVGDPPVSPAVMTSRLLDDIKSFLQEYENLDMSSACSFHKPIVNADDASYHDMASMFGFKSNQSNYRYTCNLIDKHNHAECFSNFASRLKGFFYGAHPTRRTWYQYSSAEDSLADARTVYTGNYILRPSALAYFIPFARLKLRMAGPVLGRIIKSQIGSCFVSSNLPMLHARTILQSNESEFRTGIVSNDECFDLSGEFENQYFGDVMLFTMEKLTAMGYPNIKLEPNVAMEVLVSTDREIHASYIQKQSDIAVKLNDLRKLIINYENKWPRHSYQDALKQLSKFIDNIENNFSPGSKIYNNIGSGEYRSIKINAMCDAIIEYPGDICVWNSVTRDMQLCS